MKQIIPFKKDLLFKTKVSEITSISLEHTLTLKKDDLISGEFHISGDYKMTEGSINREKFSFILPFDIALDSRYDMSSILIDIDNFYYEIVNNESLQVNIDVYVEGEKLVEEEEKKEKIEEYVLSKGEEMIEEKSEEQDLFTSNQETPLDNITIEKATLMDDRRLLEDSNVLEEGMEQTSRSASDEEEILSVAKKKSFSTAEPITDLSRKIEGFEKSIHFASPESAVLEEKKEECITNGFNLFENIDNSDTYVTYHVYVVKMEDTLEQVLSKYGVTKEEVALYNNIEEIKPGTKLIIPSTNE